MKRLLVLVEGQTEEVFVNRILAPHLVRYMVIATPTLVETRHIPGGSRDKGGLTSWAKAKRDILLRLRDTDAVTTTLFDFYGLPADFPGHDVDRTHEPNRDVVAVEIAMATDIHNQRFIPFLALHEFETWVFAGAETIATHFGMPTLVNKIEEITRRFPSIEHINNGPKTHPSRRLESLIPSYKKRSDGPTILEAVGISRIRALCPHFDAWGEST